MQTVAITGGTGLVGTALTHALLQKGYSVVVFTRNPEKYKQAVANLTYAYWNIQEQQIDAPALCKAQYIVHLAGASVAEKRWTEKRKKEIVESRVKSGALLCKTLNTHPNVVKAILSASAIGWYGADAAIPNPHPFKENFPAAKDFLGRTCYKWEQSLQPAKDAGKRLVILRTGIVLSATGGAIAAFLKPLQLGVAAVMAHGRQRVSWIHIDDLVRLYITAIETETLSGVYNAVAPQPVSNEQLMTTLARLKNGRAYCKVHIPSFALQIILGAMSIEVLKSATVSAEKLLQAHFVFQYDTIDKALLQIVNDYKAAK